MPEAASARWSRRNSSSVLPSLYSHSAARINCDAAGNPNATAMRGRDFGRAAIAACFSIAVVETPSAKGENGRFRGRAMFPDVEIFFTLISLFGLPATPEHYG